MEPLLLVNDDGKYESPADENNDEMNEVPINENDDVVDQEKEEEEEKKPRDPNAKTVSFSDVSVLEFPIIMGDNPAVSKGPPLTIDWEPQLWEEPKDIDAYEELRSRRRRHRRKLTISSQKRVVILIGSGYDLEDIAQVTLEMHKLKELRAESIKAQGLHTAIWESLIGATETTGRTLRKVDEGGLGIVVGTAEVVGLTARVLQQATVTSGKFLADTTTTIVKGTGKGTIIAGKAVGTGLTEVGKGTGKVVVGTGKVVSDVVVGTGRVIGIGTVETVKGIGKIAKGTGKLFKKIGEIGHDPEHLETYSSHAARDALEDRPRRRLSEDGSRSTLDDDEFDFPHQRMARRLSRSSSTGDLEEREKEKEEERLARAMTEGQQNSYIYKEYKDKKAKKKERRRNSAMETGQYVRSPLQLKREVVTATSSEIGDPDGVTDELRGMEDFLMALQGMDQETLEVIMAQEQLAKGAKKQRQNHKQKRSSTAYGMVTTV